MARKTTSKKKTTTRKKATRGRPRKAYTPPKTVKLPTFVMQLTDKQESYVRGALTRNLRKEGYKGSALKEFVEIGMDSKVRDLPDFIIKKLRSGKK